jgi:hypothetical protein
MTDCTEARAQLGAHLLGGLERSEADDLTAHLAVCPDCGASRARLAGVVELIDLAGPPEPPGVPGGFEERLIERATAASPAAPPRLQQRRSRLNRRSLGASVAVALAGAAAAVAIIAAVGELGGSSPPPAQIATIRLVPIGGASHAKAIVYVITKDGHTTLALEASGLPSPRHGKHFIVWLSGRGGSFSAGTIRVTKTGWATAILNSPHLASPGSTIELSIVPAGDGVKGYRTIARGSL